MWTDAKQRTERYKSNRRYLPVDEMLELPRVRLLRAMRHFDWVTMPSILEAISEPGDSMLYSAMVRLVRERHVDKRADVYPALYRITKAGREHLESLLARGQVDERKAKR